MWGPRGSSASTPTRPARLLPLRLEGIPAETPRVRLRDDGDARRVRRLGIRRVPQLPRAASSPLSEHLRLSRVQSDLEIGARQRRRETRRSGPPNPNPFSDANPTRLLAAQRVSSVRVTGRWQAAGRAASRPRRTLGERHGGTKWPRAGRNRRHDQIERLPKATLSPSPRGIGGCGGEDRPALRLVRQR